MKRVIFALGILFVFACSKTEMTTQSSTNNTRKPITIVLDSIKITGSTDTLIISKNFKFTITGYYSDKTTKDLSDSVNVLSDKSNVTINGKSIIGAQSGKSVISITYNNFSLKDSMYISAIENVDLNTLPFLTTPSNINARTIVPVVVVNYYPTLNGIDIDTKRQARFGSLDPITIESLKSKTIDELKLTKYGIEEGSKFRGFNNSSAPPNVGIKVVKYYNIYEIKKVMSADKINYFADFNNMFSKLNIKDAINNLGVKEVWFSLRPLSSEYQVVKTENLSPENFQAGGPESNMSSPTSGDVSNSWRIADDLPIYDKSYVVYTYNLHRSHAENIHNHGHQIEEKVI
jgi:hypothetical protein